MAIKKRKCKFADNGGASWSVLGPPGIPWGLLGPPGASWGLLGPPGALGARHWPSLGGRCQKAFAVAKCLFGVVKCLLKAAMSFGVGKNLCGARMVFSPKQQSRRSALQAARSTLHAPRSTHAPRSKQNAVGLNRI